MTKRNEQILKTLQETYVQPQCELHFSNTYELLVAVILSAQCTDKRVNVVTSTLFPLYNTPEKMLTLSQSELEKLIHSCGFYHNKAQSILSASEDIVNKFHGKVPGTKEDLLSLRGVGEKTANVVLAVGFGVPAIAVDTHVFRVSNRLGLANAKNVQHTQHQLEKVIPKSYWIDAHYALVLHGRYVCKALKPQCETCSLRLYCKYFQNMEKNHGNR